MKEAKFFRKGNVIRGPQGDGDIALPVPKGRIMNAPRLPFFPAGWLPKPLRPLGTGKKKAKRPA